MINLKKLGRWLGARARERSTYAGAAIIASGFGLPKVAEKVDVLGQAAEAFGLAGAGGQATATGLGVVLGLKMLGAGVAAASGEKKD